MLQFCSVEARLCAAPIEREKRLRIRGLFRLQGHVGESNQLERDSVPREPWWAQRQKSRQRPWDVLWTNLQFGLGLAGIPRGKYGKKKSRAIIGIIWKNGPDNIKNSVPHAPKNRRNSVPLPSKNRFTQSTAISPQVRYLQASAPYLRFSWFVHFYIYNADTFHQTTAENL